MNKKIKITHKIEYSMDDTKFKGDPVQENLIIDDKIILSGDWYHDKISDKIAGFLKCLEYLKKPYLLERIKIKSNIY